MKSEVESIARELLLVKHRIRQLADREKELKTKLQPLIQESGPLDLEDGRVYYSESKGSMSFNRKEVLEYIRDSYGDSLADQIDQDCTKEGKPRKLVYVKLNDL